MFHRRSAGVRATAVALLFVTLTLALVAAPGRRVAADTDIVGGREATPGEWPWQVAIVDKGPNLYNGQFCGGSLINRDWVLTAAHCVDTEDVDDIDVVAGIFNLKSPEVGYRRAAVTRIVLHPGWNPVSNDNDMALLKLATPIDERPAGPGLPIEFITLSPANVGDLVGVNTTVTGWGNRAANPPGGSDYPSKLHEVEVSILANAACNAIYDGGITANMVCAAAPGRDSCQGDSGGPLVYYDGIAAEWRQAGVVSFGTGCASEYPGVYARVARYWEWINLTLSERPVFVTAAGGSVPGAGAYQKNDILRWDGDAWSVWFNGAGKLGATIDITAFDVDDAAGGSAWLAFRQPIANLTGAGRVQPHDVVYYDSRGFAPFFDGSDVDLTTTGERINGLEVLPGSVSPIGAGCRNYLLITTVAGGAVRDRNGSIITFTGEDVLGFCLTSSGANTAGVWHRVFEGQSEGLQKNNNLGLSASNDATTIYFTPKVAFTGDGGTVRPSQLVSFSGGVFSGPLWKAADHGLVQLVDGIDVGGPLP